MGIFNKSFNIQKYNQNLIFGCKLQFQMNFKTVGKYNIGCTAGIESTGCDSTWIEGVNRMDMTWTSSKHSKNVFESLKFEKRNKQTNTILKVQ